MSKRLITLIEVEFELPEVQNEKTVLDDYKAKVYELIKNEVDDDAKINVTLAVRD